MKITLKTLIANHTQDYSLKTSLWKLLAEKHWDLKVNSRLKTWYATQDTLETCTPCVSALVYQLFVFGAVH